MSDLVSELKDDHTEVFDLLESLRGADIEKIDTQETVTLVKSILTVHLKKEDTLFYPKLEVVARFDGRLKNILMLFAADMDVVAEAALLFLSRYSNGGDAASFTKELGRTVATLKSRMHREETVLYDKYNQLMVS